MLKNYKQKMAHFNQMLPLAPHLIPLVGDKKAVKIADVGSGPYPINGQTLEGVEVETYCMDQQDFGYFYEKYGVTPTHKIEVQNMENLTYEDAFFDIVQSINALDHTRDALKALNEMIRVTKPGGYVYIDCHLIQKTNRGHNHQWDALEDGKFTNGTDTFDLKDLGFEVKFIDNGGERQFNQIICTKQC
jgi:SAM-dependent methyltransferase